MLIKHVIEVAAILFFLAGLCVTYAVLRYHHTDPWPDAWKHQQDEGTGPLEGVVVAPRPSLDAQVRATLARADTMLAVKR